MNVKLRYLKSDLEIISILQKTYKFMFVPISSLFFCFCFLSLIQNKKKRKWDDEGNEDEEGGRGW